MTLSLIIITVISTLIEIELLSAHGILLPANMHGLTEDQIADLKLSDPLSTSCTPSGGGVDNPDPTGRRNGKGNI